MTLNLSIGIAADATEWCLSKIEIKNFRQAKTF